MRFIALMIALTCFAASSSNQSEKLLNVGNTKHKDTLSMDSCFAKLCIDKISSETNGFRRFWDTAQKMGYTFADDTTVPFVKVIFQPKSVKFYTDTLRISNCKIFDSINVHEIEIRSPTHAGKYRYSNLNVEEWEFKDSIAALQFANAMGNYLNKGYGVKSPTSVLLLNHLVYIFQTAAYTFIDEMERMEKVLSAKPNILGTSY
ncbi:hypothetical protein FC093_04225 [Ilyomonas limi]|uniref:Uncharacterized protein n=1 Tax=Ilyomonas limi TaxID=2575867 RepID=A0A4U3L6N9_9BACT|nr:hypothetical protein [Ilyomonas limi]TKK70908.1 hypothetical protein FC093_04225 [Ilyomonas limi]